jgi:hypothetical protein
MPDLGSNMISLRAYGILVCGLLLWCAPPAHSQANERTVHSEIIKLNVGAYFPEIDTDISAGAEGLAAPLSFSVEDVLGFNDNLVSFRVDGSVRFSKRHRILFSYYEMERDSSAVLGRDISLRCDASVCGSEQNATIRAGTGVSAQLDWDSYVAGYAYSFYQTDTFESDIRFGANVTYLALKVTGLLDATVNGVPATFSGSAKADITAPLPWVGLGVQYMPTPKWRVGGNINGIYANISDFEGYFLDMNVFAEYMLFKNVGLGVSYNLVNANLEFDNSKWNGEVDYWYGGATAYMTVEF